MSCNFKIKFPSLATEHLEMAKEAILKHGGSFDIKGNKGTFELHIGIGKIAGNVIMNGPEVDFNITHKPFLISCGVIEKQIRKYAGMPD
jgi:hypothetical protein